MDRRTQLQLNALNQHFYASIAEAWSESRKHPWPGFQRICARLLQSMAAGVEASQLRVLDVGCGDGRFAQYLHEYSPVTAQVHYLGCDASAALLARARGRGLPEHVAFEQLDFLQDPEATALPDGPFDLVCLLGVLHHVPGEHTRRRLLRELAARVSQRPKGLLAITFWRLTDDPRFATRGLSFETYNARATDPIALSQLEPGDTLLRWGAQDNPCRYCHFPDPDETQRLIAATGLRLVERFHADGRADRLNEYALLSR